MKKLLLLLFTAFTLLSCDKDDNPQSLPPATQTGAGTFACYVNGKPFIDTRNGYFNCFYQLVDGGYYFGIGGGDNVNQLSSIIIGTYNKTISEGETLELIEQTLGNAWAGSRFILNNNSSEFSSTNIINSGQLTITKMDFTNNIVSGTFWFDVKNPYTGETVEIREGRFDTIFTQ